MIKIPKKARVYYVCYSRRLTKVTKMMSWTEITMEIDLKKITRNKFLCISLSITVIKWKISAKYMCWFAYSTENAEENMFWSQKKMYPLLKSKGKVILQQQILKRVPFIFLFFYPLSNAESSYAGFTPKLFLIHFRKQPVFRRKNKKRYGKCFWKSVLTSHDTVNAFQMQCFILERYR